MAPPQNGVFVRTHHDPKKEMRIGNLVRLNRMAVRNGEMLAAISPNVLVHAAVAHTQHTTQKPAEITLSLLATDEIQYIHLSPSAAHAIVSTKNGDNFYVHVKTNNAFATRKIKGTITAVGWNKDDSMTDTGHILLGNSKGGIYETNVTILGSVTFVKEHSASLGGDSLPVSTIILKPISDDDPKNTKWALFICLPNRLYSVVCTLDMSPPRSHSFVPSTSLQSGWSPMGMLPVQQEQPMHIFHPFFAKELYCMSARADSPVGASWLCLCEETRIPQGRHHKFLWLTGDGYTVGWIDLGAENARDLIKEHASHSHRRVEGSIECPLSLSLTEYHVLLLYPSRLTAVSFYTNNTVYEDVWSSEYGLAVGMTFDWTSNFHWVHTASTILVYRPNDEARYVWRIYLDRGEDHRAMTVARNRKDIDPHAYEFVLKKQADRFISEKNFGRAAETLALSSEPFETLVLRFLSSEDKEKTGLKMLLDKKLNNLTEPEDKMKKDALVMWLFEIQLSQLAELRKEAVVENSDEINEKLNQLTRQLHSFLLRKNVQESIKWLKDAMYRLMVAHADFETQYFVASGLRDYDTMVNIRIRRGQYKDALNILISVGSADLFYTYTPLLVDSIPSDLWDAIRKCPSIRPQKILPILCQSDNEQLAVHSIEYLESCISVPLASESLHNLLISMYARFRPNRLLPYLEAQGRDRNSVSYDVDYALRTCQQYTGLNRCTIYLYCVAEMFAEAVDLALDGERNIGLAKECVLWMDSQGFDEFRIDPNSSEFPLEMRKRIWLRIVSAMIDNGEEASAFIGLLKDSRDAIRIQDIFPLFPEFTKIEQFKEPLLSCLKEHSEKIKELQNHMKESTAVAKEIRERIEKLKKRALVVRSSDVCCACRLRLLSRPFYAHACKHFFHRDCLERQMTEFMSPEEKKQLAELLEKEKRICIELDYLEKTNGKGVMEKEMELNTTEEEIGRLIQEECPLCSNLAIDQIDKPLMSEAEYEEDVQSWLV